MKAGPTVLKNTYNCKVSGGCAVRAENWNEP